MEREIFKNKRAALILQTKTTVFLMIVSLVLTLTITAAGCYILSKEASDLSKSLLLFFYVTTFGSVYFGICANEKIIKDGYTGKWNLENSKSEFNRQLLYLAVSVLAYIIFILSIL